MADQKLTQRVNLNASDDTSLIHVVENGISYKQSKAGFLKGIVSSVPETKILSGTMIWVTGLTYESINLSYVINGLTFVIPNGTQVTLDVAPSTPTFKRFDIIYGDDTGALGVAKGTASATPVTPTLDAFQLQIKLALIDTDSTAPEGVETRAVYLEDAQETGGEFDTAENTSGARINLAYDVFPITGLYSIGCGSLQSFDKITFTNTVPTVNEDFAGITFDMKLNAIFDTGSRMSFALLNNTTLVGYAILGAEEISGIIRDDIINVQNGYVLRETFSFVNGGPTEFNKIEVSFVSQPFPAELSFIMDNVYLREDGFTVPPSGDIPTKTSQLENDGSDSTSTYVEADEIIPNPTNTSELTNDGSDGLNPYLDVTNSPYNTVIKGVASLLPTKYNLKNLFVTGTTAWTDADADRYIKNYYVDIPNDTITFYITRQYHLTIFAFNNASSLNTITHYLDWGGYVTEPGSQSFRGNTNIQEVVFPKATGDSTFVFENNSALTKLHLPYLDLAWVQNAPLLTDIDFSKAKSLINIKNIGAVGEMYAPLAKVVGFNQANGITSWYLPNVETLSGNMYNNSPITSLYAPNCKTYSATLRNANLITSLHLPNVTNASGLVARAFESDALTEIYMPKAKSFGREAVVEGMFDGSTIGAGCTLTVNEFLRTSNGGAMNINLVQAISRGIKVVFAKDVNIALDNRILNASVTTTYDFDHSKASDWKLTMIADTTFTESNLPTLDKTIEYTFKLTGAFTPTFPAYWDVLGDTYDGALWNFIAVQVHNGNSGSEEVTVFITNIQ